MTPTASTGMTGRARVFTRERDVIAALKGQEGEPVVEGEVIVLAGRGPLGSGMEETYQVTSFLRYLPTGRGIALVTDARFSGVSTGPVHRARQPGGARGRTDRQARRRRPRPDRRRHAEPGGVGRAGRTRRRGVDGGGGGGRAGGTSDEPGDPAGRGPTGGHGALGRACSRSAAACGAGASTTSSRSPRRSVRVRWTRRRRIIDYRAH